MELEKIATNAVETSIAKTDRLTSFISRGDKEPCWDGNIYIHEGKDHTKHNIKKVSTQVKGKAVTPAQLKETIKYRIFRDDLVAYMMNGGVIFFVVYIDKITGDALQIYYTELLPVKIRSIMTEGKNSFQVRFQKFPEDNLEKTSIFLRFHSDAQRQASFAGKELPTIEELAKRGVLESLTFHCTAIGKYRTHSAVPKIMDGRSLSLYANIKGGSAPIPVEYFESIHQVTMSTRNDVPVYVNGTQYYDGYQVITTANTVELYIGSCVKIISPNNEGSDEPVTTTIKVKITGTLKQQIAGLEFVIAMIEHEHFSIGTHKVPSKFPEAELKKLNAIGFRETLTGYKRAQALLDSMNVTKDLEIQKCTEEDLRKLNLLIAAIGDKLPVKDEPDSSANVQKMTIANLTLAVVYLKKKGGGYHIFDYFGNHFAVSWAPNGTEPTEVSQFFSMGSDDFLTFDNLNLKTVVEDFKRIKATTQHMEHGNNTMLYMLKAYDKQPSAELLDAARQMCEWLREYPDLIPAEITTLNRLQINLRERMLTFPEKAELYAIVDVAADDFLKLGAFLLLGEQQEAKGILDSLSEEDLGRFKTFPIYRFYENPQGRST